MNNEANRQNNQIREPEITTRDFINFFEMFG